jgi:hypothetical protein
MSDDAITTFTHNGYTIKIVLDDIPLSPREDCNIGRFALDHKRYNLAWEIEDLEQRNPYYTDEDGDERRCQSWEDVLTAIRQTLVEQGDEMIVFLQVFGYDHGGLTISTNVERGWWHYAWDGGRLGWIVATRKTLSEAGLEFDTPEKLAEIERQLIAEVETYDAYLTGNVYGYVIENKDGEHVDSCFGFYGFEYVKQAAKEACPEPDLEGEPEI